ncbi:LOB domain-containing protein 22-like [Malania oleifera]|uniref:LOB domain-containing protein 22-like n=1 Tax=Malania oleifera TaxID=397392 RepID=UPI0025AE6B50|nr:LOB domain-containing protein 22-like [Malania oleifera]
MSSREGGGSPQACASCKHQRKKCDDGCELAPYFPATKFQDFQNAHRLFGVGNIIKILNSIEPHHRAAAADSIIQEAKIWKDDPVHGCLGLVQSLQSQIGLCEKELDAINQQLLFLQEKKQQKRSWSHSSYPPSSLLSPSSSVFLKLPLNQIGESHRQAPLLNDLDCKEAFYGGNAKTLDDGHNYESTFGKGVDLKPLDGVMDEDQHEPPASGVGPGPLEKARDAPIKNIGG